MISSEMVKYLLNQQDLVDMAIQDRAQGNHFGASCLIREYEERVEQELDFWHVDWAYAYSLGLLVDTVDLY